MTHQKMFVLFSLSLLSSCLIQPHHAPTRRKNPIFIPHMIRSHHTLAAAEASEAIMATDKVSTGSSSCFIRLSTQLIPLRGWVTQLGILRQISSTRRGCRRGKFDEKNKESRSFSRFSRCVIVDCVISNLIRKTGDELILLQENIPTPIFGIHLAIYWEIEECSELLSDWNTSRCHSTSPIIFYGAAVWETWHVIGSRRTMNDELLVEHEETWKIFSSCGKFLLLLKIYEIEFSALMSSSQTFFFIAGERQNVTQSWNFSVMWKDCRVAETTHNNFSKITCYFLATLPHRVINERHFTTALPTFSHTKQHAQSLSGAAFEMIKYIIFY